MNREGVMGCCFGKASYRTVGEAKRVIERVLRRKARKPTWCGGSKMVAYRCRSCGQYHVGNDAKASRDGY